MRYNTITRIIEDNEKYNEITSRKDIKSKFAILDEIVGEIVQSDDILELMQDLDNRLIGYSKVDLVRCNKLIFNKYGDQLDDHEQRILYIIKSL